MKNFNKNSILILFVFSFVFSLTLPKALLADDNLTPVNLGGASNFVILAKTGISTTGSTSIIGDIGISPAAATYITGFGLTANSFGPFSTSSLVNGKVYAPGYADPAPANLTAAVLDMQNAYTDAMGREPNVTELGAGNIGGLTLTPGVYKWGTSLTIPTDVTLSGDSSDIWIFQVAQNLDLASAAKIVLADGAQANNVFWVVAGQTTIGTTAIFNGNILDQTAIVLKTGATLNGRALAQSAVTLDANAVTIPTGVSIISNPAPVSTNSSPNNNSGVTGGNSSISPTTIANPTAINMQGCISMNGFNTITGKSCGNSAITSNPIVVIPGCNGNTGFSTITGNSCMGNSVGFSTVTTSKYNFGSVTLKSGSQGEAVMELQRFLNAKLNLGLSIDGKLGPKTISVIKKWQSDNGLVADGLIGVKTKIKMNAMDR